MVIISIKTALFGTAPVPKAAAAERERRNPSGNRNCIGRKGWFHLSFALTGSPDGRWGIKFFLHFATSARPTSRRPRQHADIVGSMSTRPLSLNSALERRVGPYVCEYFFLFFTYYTSTTDCIEAFLGVDGAVTFFTNVNLSAVCEDR